MTFYSAKEKLRIQTYLKTKVENIEGKTLNSLRFSKKKLIKNSNFSMIFKISISRMFLKFKTFIVSYLSQQVNTEHL